MSMGFLPFLAPLAGAIGSGLGAAATGIGSALGGLGGAAGGLMKAGGGLLGKGLGGIGKTLFGSGGGGGGLLGSLFKGGKQIYGGLDTMTGGLLPGGQSPFQKGGLFGAFNTGPKGAVHMGPHNQTSFDTDSNGIPDLLQKRPPAPSGADLGGPLLNQYPEGLRPAIHKNLMNKGGILGKAYGALQQKYKPQPAPPPSSYDPRSYSSAPPAAGPESGRGALFNNFSA